MAIFLSCQKHTKVAQTTKKLPPQKTTTQSKKVEPKALSDASSKVNKSEKEFKQPPHIVKFCQNTQRKFTQYGWGKTRCLKYRWNHVRHTFLGNPLIWKVFGNEVEHKKNPRNSTLVFCGVHADEITPIKFCFDIIRELSKGNLDLEKSIVIVAPNVNPDSFFRKYPKRTNYRGVDLNRNFPTKDWDSKALRYWKNKYRRDKRRYPGKRPLSEQETIFQVNLIKRYRPDKIISIHAPLTMLDYDGPTNALHKHQGHNGLIAGKLLSEMSKQASGYRIKDYPFFPGSLGNWAGNERNIPTYTLELPSSDNRMSKTYWKKFKGAIFKAFETNFKETTNGSYKTVVSNDVKTGT